MNTVCHTSRFTGLSSVVHGSTLMSPGKVMRRAARRDIAEGPIVKGLHEVFGSEISIDSQDNPDLSIGYQGRTFGLEIKTDKGKLREDQHLWHMKNKGEAYAVNNLEDAILAVQGTLIENAPDPMFRVDQLVYVDQKNGWVRAILARKYLLGEWWYLSEGEEVLSESALQNLM